MSNDESFENIKTILDKLIDKSVGTDLVVARLIDRVPDKPAFLEELKEMCGVLKETAIEKSQPGYLDGPIRQIEFLLDLSKREDEDDERG